jgi:hypothetical protein
LKLFVVGLERSDLASLPHSLFIALFLGRVFWLLVVSGQGLELREVFLALWQSFGTHWQYPSLVAASMIECIGCLILQ